MDLIVGQANQSFWAVARAARNAHDAGHRAPWRTNLGIRRELRRGAPSRATLNQNRGRAFALRPLGQAKRTARSGLVLCGEHSMIITWITDKSASWRIERSVIFFFLLRSLFLPLRRSVTQRRAPSVRAADRSRATALQRYNLVPPRETNRAVRTRGGRAPPLPAAFRRPSPAAARSFELYLCQLSCYHGPPAILPVTARSSK